MTLLIKHIHRHGMNLISDLNTNVTHELQFSSHCDFTLHTDNLVMSEICCMSNFCLSTEVCKYVT